MGCSSSKSNNKQEYRHSIERDVSDNSIDLVIILSYLNKL